MVEKSRRKSVSPHLSQWLDLDITADELLNAMKQLKNKKSPGKDGLPAEFFSSFKECLIHPLLEVWKEAFRFKALPLPINEGIIKLIHKKEEKDIISNWRPITLLNCAYKIYAKALALRLRDHMKVWFQQEQKGFIKGRFILDNIVTLWEAKEYAEESGQDYIFSKLILRKLMTALIGTILFRL